MATELIGGPSEYNGDLFIVRGQSVQSLAQRGISLFLLLLSVCYRLCSHSEELLQHILWNWRIGKITDYLQGRVSECLELISSCALKIWPFPGMKSRASFYESIAWNRRSVFEWDWGYCLAARDYHDSMPGQSGSWGHSRTSGVVLNQLSG